MAAPGQDEPRDDEPKEAVEFILDFVKDLPERQNHDWEAMETKAVQILTAASVVIGLASIGARSGDLSFPLQVVFTIGLGAYMDVLWQTARVLRIRKIRRARQAKWLWDHRLEDVKNLKASMIEDVIEAYAENLDTLDLKARGIKLSLVALGIEAFAVISALIWTRL